MPRRAGRLPVVVAEPVPLAGKAGLTSRARRRAEEARELDLRVNRAIAALQQLWHGRLSDGLLSQDLTGSRRHPTGEEGAVADSGNDDE